MEKGKFIFYVSLIGAFLITFFVSFTITSNAVFSSAIERSGIITLGRSNVMFSTGTTLFENIQVEPGETLNYPIKVINALDANGQNTSGLIDCFLRIQITTLSNGFSTNVATANLANQSEWISGNDGYLYYKKIFKVGDEVQVFSSFSFASILPVEVIENGLVISILAETIQSTPEIYNNMWPTAPAFNDVITQ